MQADTRRGEAEKLLAELVKRSHQGETVVSEKLTIAQYLTGRWLPVQAARLRESTYDSYRRNIELQVIPALGKRTREPVTMRWMTPWRSAALSAQWKEDRCSG